MQYEETSALVSTKRSKTKNKGDIMSKPAGVQRKGKKKDSKSQRARKKKPKMEENTARGKFSGPKRSNKKETIASGQTKKGSLGEHDGVLGKKKYSKKKEHRGKTPGSQDEKVQVMKKLRGGKKVPTHQGGRQNGPVESL